MPQVDPRSQQRQQPQQRQQEQVAMQAEQAEQRAMSRNQELARLLRPQLKVDPQTGAVATPTPEQAAAATISAHVQHAAISAQLAALTTVMATNDAAYRKSLGLDNDGQPIVNDDQSWYVSPTVGVYRVTMENGVIVSVTADPPGTSFPRSNRGGTATVQPK